MPTRKNTQKHLPAAKAHLNELLDEALKQTFPASDPIAINVEGSITRGTARASRAARKQAQDAVEAGGMRAQWTKIEQGNDLNLDIRGSVACGLGRNIFLCATKGMAQNIRRLQRHVSRERS